MSVTTECYADSFPRGEALRISPLMTFVSLPIALTACQGRFSAMPRWNLCSMSNLTSSTLLKPFYRNCYYFENYCNLRIINIAFEKHTEIQLSASRKAERKVHM